MIDHASLFIELNKKLNEQGYTIAASTIRKYISHKLTEGPKIDRLGKGKGTKSNYRDEALGELYAAWMLLNGPIQTSLERLKKIRPIAIRLNRKREINVYAQTVSKLRVTWKDLAYLIELYINYCEETGLQPTSKLRVEMGYVQNGKCKFHLIEKKIGRIAPRQLKGK